MEGYILCYYESIWNNLKSFEIKYILFEYKSIFEILYDYSISIWKYILILEYNRFGMIYDISLWNYILFEYNWFETEYDILVWKRTFEM